MIFPKILDLVELCHVGTLKKAEIEAVLIDLILIEIASGVLRGTLYLGIQVC